MQKTCFYKKIKNYIAIAKSWGRCLCQVMISTSLWCLCISAHSHARCCSNYSDFLSRHRALVTRLLSQGYKVNRLSNTFKKFYGRHTDLVGQCKKSVCQMFADSISRNDFYFYVINLPCTFTHYLELSNFQFYFMIWIVVF